MCLYSRVTENRKYIPNKKNGGNPPPITDKRTSLVPIGCGKCIECRKQKARAWQVRLHEEIRTEKNGKFVTLTFSDESINQLINGEDLNGKQVSEPIQLQGYELDNEIATIAIRRFLERWRKKYTKSVRHWMVTELGQTNTERIHLHGIIWTNEILDISTIWQYGIVTIGKRKYLKGKELNKNDIGYVNEKTINYITKYVNKTDEKHKEYKSIILTSNGIGRNYINRIDSKKNTYNGEKTNETYTTRNGMKINMPTYYRNAIYTEEEKEKLWIQKLDKNERWICGERIDTTNGEELYYRVLEIYREKNRRLGYGNDEKNWERKRYENQRRNIIVKERAIKNINKEDTITKKLGIVLLSGGQDAPLITFSEKENVTNSASIIKNNQLTLGLIEKSSIFVHGIDPNGKII